ncbi:FAD-dependent oxidoreductase [Ruminococcaceae bacterium OttesenSCG-928-O06]|nr:FAD-dependent oxidoreductase [Ruminococcaceae bacterium OttesenSCG-928-O06]
MKYERLFAPITINGMELKNRLVMPALHHLYTPEGHATERFNKYYWRRAEGGVGLIIVGGCRFDDYGGGPYMMSLRTDEFIPGYKEFTDGVHQRGAKVAVQLYHGGRYSGSKYNPGEGPPLAPSAVYSHFSRETPQEMTKAQIDEVIKNWADGAVRAQKAGFDAVEILGSAGYLISQFLSLSTNQRTDEYGGSWENRTRFPLQVIRAVRAAVGPGYPLILRVAGNDFVPGANTNENAVEFAKLAEEAGIDCLNVTGGWHETRVPQLPGDLPRGGFVYLASAIKKAVNIPVMACNRINRPDVAERILAMDQADLIGISRPLVADPDWVNKAYEEREDEIRGCVACNQGCLAKTFFGKPVECLVNGEAGREYLLEDVKAPEKLKNILVVGGGPGGCEFALRAAERGHTVTIWEKDAALGGQLNVVYAPPGKREFENLVKYYDTMLKKRGVKVELNREATPESVQAGGFDEVVVATGVTPITIPLPQTSKAIPVYNAMDVLEGKVFPGKDIVVVGGGSVGCETAQYLVHEGAAGPDLVYFLMHQKAETPEKIERLINESDRNVTIVELAKIGAGFEPGTGWPVMDDLKRMGVKLFSTSKLLEVGEDSVQIEVTDKEGNVKTVTVPCDGIVLAVGSRSNTALYDAIKEKMPTAHLLGDAAQVGKVIDAIRQASDLAVSV